MGILPAHTIPSRSLRWMMTLESSFEELNFLVICLTLRSISKWMGWCQLPTLQRGGKQPRWRAFSQRKRSRTRSVGSERSITWPIHIFQNFMKISVLDTSEVDCSNIVELRFIRRDALLPQGELLHESSNEVECRRQALEFALMCLACQKFTYIRSYQSFFYYYWSVVFHL